ncbi:MAG: glycerol-3-phosphate acyltransferase, partial [Actinomycetota bacterium]
MADSVFARAPDLRRLGNGSRGLALDRGECQSYCGAERAARSHPAAPSRPRSADGGGGSLPDSYVRMAGMAVVLLVPVAWALGTFPTAVTVARARGRDVLGEGSGNPGASNIGRLLGWRWGILVLAVD